MTQNGNLSPTYATIVPQEVQEELMQINHTDGLMAWRLGALVDQTITYCKANFPTTPRMDIYSAIAAFWGRSSRSVREYYQVYTAYQNDDRIRFETLAFEHFRVALTLPVDPLSALEWCDAETERLGRPATVDAMVMHFTPTTDDNLDDQDGQDEASELAGKLYRYACKTQLRLNLLSGAVPSGDMERLHDIVAEMIEILKPVACPNG